MMFHVSLFHDVFLSLKMLSMQVANGSIAKQWAKIPKDSIFFFTDGLDQNEKLLKCQAIQGLQFQADSYRDGM